MYLPKVDSSCKDLLMPSDTSLLTMQDSHITNLIWSGKFRDRIRPNDHSLSVCDWKLTDEAQKELLKKSGFYEMLQAGYVHLDSHLITAVLDRWRPETNTFHFPFGEMTVTLEDVAYILGLPVSGKVICGPVGCPDTPIEFVKKMLGHAPEKDSDDLSGNRIRLTWLRKTFENKNKTLKEAQVLQATRAYILYLLGSTIFSDSGTGYVHLMYLSLLDKLEEASSYAWGGAALAYLYRAMTKAVTVTNGTAPINLCGSFTLLMCWIFEHIPIGRPKFEPGNCHLFPLACKWNKACVSGHQPYLCLRPSLDKLCSKDVTFQPYKDFPKPCKSARKSSQRGCVDLVLICFHIIATYNGTRCMRQFGKVQDVPNLPIQLKACYGSRPSTKENYVHKYSKHIKAWDDYVKHPSRFVKVGVELMSGTNTTLPYKIWYERVAICRVEPYNCHDAKVVRENRELKEFLAEYSVFIQPYIKNVLKDEHNRITELFDFLAPLGAYYEDRVERSRTGIESADCVERRDNVGSTGSGYKSRDDGDDNEFSKHHLNLVSSQVGGNCQNAFDSGFRTRECTSGCGEVNGGVANPKIVGKGVNFFVNDPQHRKYATKTGASVLSPSEETYMSAPVGDGNAEWQADISGKDGEEPQSDVAKENSPVGQFVELTPGTGMCHHGNTNGKDFSPIHDDGQEVNKRLLGLIKKISIEAGFDSNDSPISVIKENNGHAQQGHDVGHRLNQSRQEMIKNAVGCNKFEYPISVPFTEDNGSVVEKCSNNDGQFHLQKAKSKARAVSSPVKNPLLPTLVCTRSTRRSDGLSDILTESAVLDDCFALEYRPKKKKARRAP